MKGKAVIPLVLGLCMGLLAIKYYGATKSTEASPTKKTTIIRALTDIPPHSEIQPGQVEVVEIAGNPMVPANELVQKKEDVIGRVTSKSIPMNVPVMQSMLAPPGTPAGMAGAIPPGFRAVSVKIDEVTGVSYQINPGSWVDVIVVMDVMDPNNRKQKDTVAEVILQHVKVAAIGLAGVSQTDASASKGKGAKSATLVVPEEEVPRLHLAATRGKITLALRGDDNTKSSSFAFASMNQLFSGMGDQKPDNSTSTEIAPPAQVVASSNVTVDIGAMFSSLTSSLASSSTQSKRPEPFAVTIYRGSPDATSVRVENLTFESSNSRILLQRRGGATAGGRSRNGAQQDMASPFGGLPQGAGTPNALPIHPNANRPDMTPDTMVPLEPVEEEEMGN